MKKIKNLKFIITLFILIIILLGFGFKILNENNQQKNIKDNIEITSNEKKVKSVDKKIDDINKNIIEELKKQELDKLNKLKEKQYIFAFFGTDERGSEISRSDIIMVLKYIPKSNQIYLVSIPRDTRVKIPGKYQDKINHSYAFGGIDLISLTLENFLDINIDYYIKMSFENFKYIINSIGGVEIVSIKDYKYPGYIDIPRGKQILKGEKALEYVRFRYDEQGDFGRIKRQHQVLTELINRINNTKIGESDQLIKKIYSKVNTNLTIDSFMNFKKLISISKEIEIESEILKTNSKIIDEIWYEIYDKSHLQLIKEKLNHN